eukprot:2359588-Pyramimonas_sp.AAC.1
MDRLDGYRRTPCPTMGATMGHIGNMSPHGRSSRTHRTSVTSLSGHSHQTWLWSRVRCGIWQVGGSSRAIKPRPSD